MLAKIKKILALALAMALVMGFVPVSVSAAGVSELAVGQKLAEVFPDEVFRNWVLTKTKAYDDEVGLTQADIDAIEKETCVNPSNAAGKVEDITGVSHFVSATNINFANHAVSEIPAEIGKMTQLTDINFSACSNITEIPEEIGLLVNLKILNLFNNSITEVPDIFTDLVNLNTFQIAFNKVEQLPESLFTLPNLEFLALANNKLSSVSGIENLPSLGKFTLANNMITDIRGAHIVYNRTNGHRQGTGQRVYTDAVTVKQGQTSLVVDLNDDTMFNFHYDSFNFDGDKIFGKNDIFLGWSNGTFNDDDAKVGVFNKLTGPLAQNHFEEGNMTLVDRDVDSTYEIFFDANAEYAYIRLGDPCSRAKEIPGDFGWTSFYAFDVLYIIPLLREETPPPPPPTPSTYEIIVNHVNRDTGANLYHSRQVVEEGATWDETIAEYAGLVYDGHEGDALSGTITNFSVNITLYYVEEETIETTVPMTEMTTEEETTEEEYPEEEITTAPALAELPETGVMGLPVDPAWTLGSLAVLASLGITLKSRKKGNGDD